mgnify:FL=1
MELREYQSSIALRASEILQVFGYVYLAMQVRTGKTITSLQAAINIGSTNILFITKKKAISSIVSDAYKLKCNVTVINYESIHKLPNDIYDCIILDEAHSIGAFPKPSRRAKEVKILYTKSKKPPVILLSGTPTPESYSQMYHQLYFLHDGPYNKYTNFYKWAADYVDIKQKWIGGTPHNDYSGARQEMVDKSVSDFTITLTQKEAGFASKVDEEVLYVDCKLNNIISKLKKDFIVEGKTDTIIADTGAKMMQKIHQLYSGTIIFESGKTGVLDTTKAEFIKERFSGEKIAIFYKFVAELDAIRSVFPDITTDLSEFDSTNKNIALQIVSGREGISLKNAKYIVFYNIDFSATSYWQARDRMTTADRKHNKIFWIFSRGGIEDKIYETVNKKKNYTLSHFKKDFISL